MKVLWLSGNPASYLASKNAKGYNGGGWIGALETLLIEQDDVELAVSFIYPDDCFKTKINKTTYYPINLYHSIYEKLMHNLFYERSDVKEIERVKKIIDDFQPDVIHVWGSETSFGLISKYTKVPVIIHLQGILNPYLNAFLIPGCSKKKYVLEFGKKSIYQRIVNLQTLRFWKHNAKRELEIFRNCRYYLGRTKWDQSISTLFSPDSQYFYCSELLRNPFYNAKMWEPHNRGKLIVISVLSTPSYKGMDLVLKTANILKSYGSIDFEWNVWGATECIFSEKLTGLKAKNVNVIINGVASAETLVTNIQNSDLFVHTSYIDNSPNSVCEAQLIGIPVISTNVGGIGSIIENDKSGLLVPANDPYYLASQILRIFFDKNEAKKLGINGKMQAIKRHNPLEIISSLIKHYHNILIK